MTKKTTQSFLIISAIFLILLISGCVNEGGMTPLSNLDLDNDKVNEEDSVVDDLTPIVSIGDDVSVAVYKCTTDTDCNRCKNEDVYTQTCVINDDETVGTCQGPLDLAEDCKDTCSAGACVDKDEFTADDNTVYIAGEDYDLTDDSAIVNKDDLLPDPTQCTKEISTCIGYRGNGSAYLSDFPECECKLIYVPAYCNPNDPPCQGYVSRTDYPDCACE